MSASNNRTPVPVLKLDSRLSSPYGPSGDQSGNDNLLKMAMQSSPISKGAKETSTPQQQQPDWVAYYDEESGHEYLYNQRTGESKWPSPAKQQREPAGGYSYNNENADDSNTASQTGGGDYGHYNIGGQDPWIRGYDDHVRHPGLPTYLPISLQPICALTLHSTRTGPRLPVQLCHRRVQVAFPREDKRPRRCPRRK